MISTGALDRAGRAIMASEFSVGALPASAEWVAPDLVAFERIARSVYSQLPDRFRAQAGHILFVIADFPEEKLIEELGIEDPFELTGLFEGPDPMGRESAAMMGEPARIHLFRRAILDEWADNGEVTLGDLIAHVLIHEIGHHFGLSDDDIDALLEGDE